MGTVQFQGADQDMGYSYCCHYGRVCFRRMPLNWYSFGYHNIHLKNINMMNVPMQAINQTIAVEYLKFFYPPIRNEIDQLSVQENFAGVIQAIVNYLKRLLHESKINIIAHHIKLMDWIYRKSNSYVRTMIENLFIRSFESFKKLTKIQNWKLLYQHMSIEFQQIYMNQNKLDEIMFKK